MAVYIDGSSNMIKSISFTYYLALFQLITIQLLPGIRKFSPALSTLVFVIGSTHTATAEIERKTFTHNEQTRVYFLFPPEDITVDANLLPLLVVLHGGGGGAEQIAETTGFTALARQHRVIVVYPEGIVKGGKFATWNAGTCCGAAHERNVDDVGFIRELITELVQRYPIDPRRIYLTGHSNGAMLAYRVACEASDLIAAIAPVGGVEVSACTPMHPVSVLHIHGKKDSCALYDPNNSDELGHCPTSTEPDGSVTRLSGGCFQLLVNRILGTKLKPVCWPAPSVASTISRWEKRNRCEPSQPSIHSNAAISCTTSACADATEVTSCVIPEGGHAWPGGIKTCGRARACRISDEIIGTSDQGVDASELIWKIISRYRKIEKYEG